MANTSILTAFERMWQHTLAVLSNKSEKDHTHAIATETDAGFMGAGDKVQLTNGGIPIVPATVDGDTLIATLEGVAELTAGMKITVIPNTAAPEDTLMLPTLNLNNLGKKLIRVRIAGDESTDTSTRPLTPAEWWAEGRPITLQYNGRFWLILDYSYPSADCISGAVPIEKGGTGAEAVETARANLQVAQALESTDYLGCYYRIIDGEYEWINPPMKLNNMYRTTERYNNKVVRISVHETSLSNGLNTFHMSTISSAAQIIEVHGILMSDDGNKALSLPFYHSANDYCYFEYVGAGDLKYQRSANYDSGYKIRFTIKQVD